MALLTDSDRDLFNTDGYLVVRHLLSPQEVAHYQEIYDAFLTNAIDTSRYRSDLSGGDGPVEKITQIMVPSKIRPSLLEDLLHQRLDQLAKELLGSDMALDFDMLINKAPHTNTPTPWHQDAAYWIDMPDKRAVSCWVALDPAIKDNGCMWYVSGSHLKPLRNHHQIGNKGALQCEGHESEGQFVELSPGSVVLHHGHTLHYSRGNSTDRSRRAFILNFRPQAMIAMERAQGVDHTGERQIRR